MAAELTQDAVLCFLRSRGGSVTNTDLLLHFRPFLRDHADQSRNRDIFKRFINSVARVKQEDGVSYVVLQRKFRGHSACVGPGVSGLSKGASPGVSAPGNVLSPLWNADNKPRVNKSPELGAIPAGPLVLPAAGIINKNSVEPNLNLPPRKVQQSPLSGTSPAQVALTIPASRVPHVPVPAPPLTHTALPQAPVRKEAKVAPEPRDRVPVALEPRVRVPVALEPRVRVPVALEPRVRVPVALEPRVRVPVALEPRVRVPVALEPRERAPVALEPRERASVALEPRERAPVALEPRERAPVALEPRERAPVALEPRERAPRTLTPLGSSVSPGTAPDMPGHVRGEASVRPVERDSAPRRVRLRQSYRSAVSVEEDDGDEEEVAPGRRASAPFESAAVWGGDTMGGRGMSQSTPALDTIPTQIHGSETSVRSLEERHLPGLPPAPPAVWPPKVSPVRTVPQIHIEDLDPRHGSDPEPRFRRTPSPLTSHHLYSSSSSVEQSPQASAWSSCEELSHRALGLAPVQGVPRLRTKVTRIGSSHQRPLTGTSGGPGAAEHQREGGWSQSAEGQISGGDGGRAWHRSIGDLYDDEEEISDSSTPWLAQLRPSVTRRQSGNLRSRMCLSVGADLDQIMDEEDRRALGGSTAARLHRLHLISSSLSLGHMSLSSVSSSSTPPRCHSLADLTVREPPKERSVLSSAHHQEGHSRQNQVPLEEREHLWLVKAAAGTWPDIYSLFREDPSLLQRRDFVSGFTVLHWIAKHGDHRVLNTLWYGVEKLGMAFDTDTQSSCGYTPLHIAAIHNHKNIIRLLVNKFGASVSLRDAAGKKAWSYLPQEAPPDLFQLLGAPAKAALGQTGVAQLWASPQTRQQSQKRRRRHHFSSASGQRPIVGDAKVKRTSSFAFLKHKTLQKVKAEWAI